MVKPGTTAATAVAYSAKSAQTRKGPYDKNLQPSAKRKPRPTAPTGPLKGPDKGGV
jgi:hypothetical protein